MNPMHIIPRLADVPDHVRAMLRTASEDSLAVAGDWLEESAAAGAFVRAVGREDAIAVMRIQEYHSGLSLAKSGGYAVALDGGIVLSSHLDMVEDRFGPSWMAWGADLGLPRVTVERPVSDWVVTLRGDLWREHPLLAGDVNLVLPLADVGFVGVRARCTSTARHYDRRTQTPDYAEGVYRGVEVWRAAFR